MYYYSSNSNNNSGSDSDNDTQNNYGIGEGKQEHRLSGLSCETMGLLDLAAQVDRDPSSKNYIIPFLYVNIWLEM